MAARLEALAQYYRQHGFFVEADELTQRAKEYRKRGVPDEFPQEISIIDQRNIRFASPDEPLEVAKKYFNGFESKPVEVPQVGEVVLTGYREVASTPSNAERNYIGVTIRDGQLLEGRYLSMARKKNMFELEIEVKEGRASIDLPSGHTLVCRMDIDGFDKAFETLLDECDDAEAFPDITHTHWSGADPEDTNTYVFLASPTDTDLLSKVSFSFYCRLDVSLSPY